MESVDPFYVPERFNEIISFLGAASLGALLLVSPFFLRLTLENVGLLLAVGLVVAMTAYRGFQARRYRLMRIEKVRRLRNPGLDDADVSEPS